MNKSTWLLFLSLFLFSMWETSEAQLCPYYGADRIAEPEGNLANCSWFGKKACCKRTEVTSVFSDMFKLFGATKECEDRLNYLNCYFCSPDQEIWFREKATICRSFCDSIYEHCADAWFEDRMIRDIFTDKTLQDGGFCKDNFFDVVDSEKDCYKFDAVPFSRAESRLYINTNLVAILCLTFVFVRQFV
ncbi:hypothetical protein RvY_02475 [Ramazzottius varieornatus]|uniref:Folate receptor-like domain-containing protein n=1 Tax=Ramazzottius varieornatus TaxID=947166 RepID=A0A1D1UKL7_RAMVA|nr:hypothetical protein RvY_02475 [Ramazzottius varieornatus]